MLCPVLYAPRVGLRLPGVRNIMIKSYDSGH